MLLTIHNLPLKTQYGDVKDLIISKCGLRDAIVDNLVKEGGTMKVTVGVMQEGDAAILVRKLNGIFYRGQQLYIQDKRQKKAFEQPYRTTLPPDPMQQQYQPPQHQHQPPQHQHQPHQHQHQPHQHHHQQQQHQHPQPQQHQQPQPQQPQHQHQNQQQYDMVHQAQQYAMAMNSMVTYPGQDMASWYAAGNAGMGQQNAYPAYGMQQPQVMPFPGMEYGQYPYYAMPQDTNTAQAPIAEVRSGAQDQGWSDDVNNVGHHLPKASPPPKWSYQEPKRGKWDQGPDRSEHTGRDGHGNRRSRSLDRHEPSRQENRNAHSNDRRDDRSDRKRHREEPARKPDDPASRAGHRRAVEAALPVTPRILDEFGQNLRIKHFGQPSPLKAALKEVVLLRIADFMGDTYMQGSEIYRTYKELYPPRTESSLYEGVQRVLRETRERPEEKDLIQFVNRSNRSHSRGSLDNQDSRGNSQNSYRGDNRGSRFDDKRGLQFDNNRPSKFDDNQSSRFDDKKNTRFGDNQSSRFGDNQSSRFGDNQSSRFGDNQSSRFDDKKSFGFDDNRPPNSVSHRTSRFEDFQNSRLKDNKRPLSTDKNSLHEEHPAKKPRVEDVPKGTGNDPLTPRTTHAARRTAMMSIFTDTVTHMNMQQQMSAPSPLKSVLRKLLTLRVTEIAGNQFVEPDDIHEQYREIYPHASDYTTFAALQELVQGPKLEGENLKNFLCTLVTPVIRKHSNEGSNVLNPQNAPGPSFNAPNSAQSAPRQSFACPNSVQNLRPPFIPSAKRKSYKAQNLEGIPCNSVYKWTAPNLQRPPFPQKLPTYLYPEGPEKSGPPNNSGPSNRPGPLNNSGPTNRPGPSNNSRPTNRPGPSKNSGPANRPGPSNNSGPANRPGPSNNSGPSNNTGPGNKSGPPEKLQNQENRSVSNGTLKSTAKQIMADIGKALRVQPLMESKTNLFVKALQTAIITRLRNFAGVPAEGLYPAYYETYPKSEMKEFYKKVRQRINTTSQFNQARVDPYMKEWMFTLVKDLNPLVLKVGQNSKIHQPGPKVREPPLGPSTGVIPSYPKGDKKDAVKLKRKEKIERITLPVFEISPAMDKALCNEINHLGEIMKQEFRRPLNEGERAVFGTVNHTSCIEYCQRFIAHAISKRITGQGVKMCRIYGHPKPPKKPDVTPFLSQYNCIALKKSVKNPFLTASFESYEVVNQLCAMEPINIAGNMISFKPMNLVPPKRKPHLGGFKTRRKKYIKSLIDNSQVNLLDKDWPIKDEEEKRAKEDQEKMYESSDEVIIVENDASLIDLCIDEDQSIVEEKEKKQQEKITEQKKYETDQTNTQNTPITVANEPKANDTEAKNESKAKVDSETNQGDQGFLHEDFQVIDEVRDSDNDENDIKQSKDKHETTDENEAVDENEAIDENEATDENEAVDANEATDENEAVDANEAIDENDVDDDWDQNGEDWGNVSAETSYTVDVNNIVDDENENEVAPNESVNIADIDFDEDDLEDY